MELKPDSFGTIWYADLEGARIPVDPEREFGPEWPGHGHDGDESGA